VARDETEGRIEGGEQKAAGLRHVARREPPDAERDPAACDLCGVPALVWRTCKLVCENCGAINKTCADL
jgi:hypothetical protein